MPSGISRFAAVEVEELSNISRKMDIDNESLKRIEGNTVEMKGSLKIAHALKNVLESYT